MHAAWQLEEELGADKDGVGIEGIELGDRALGGPPGEERDVRVRGAL